jgi:hypothetical protein
MPKFDPHEPFDEASADFLLQLLLRHGPCVVVNSMNHVGRCRACGGNRLQHAQKAFTKAAESVSGWKWKPIGRGRDNRTRGSIGGPDEVGMIIPNYCILSSAQKSEPTISPPARVPRARQVVRLMALVTGRTEPSINMTFTSPPEW